jgi:CubicO group peptidase (beta-lactamase class C family)
VKRHAVILPVIAAFSALVLLPSDATGQVKKDDNAAHTNARNELDGYFARVMAAQRYVGLGACLIKDGEIVWQSSFGFANREEKKALQNDAITGLHGLYV